jgi:hypothetical protein
MGALTGAGAASFSRYPGTDGLLCMGLFSIFWF